MRSPTRHSAQSNARTLTLICLIALLALAGHSWLPSLRQAWAEGLKPSIRLAGVKANSAPLKLRPAIEGDRSINFGESRDLQAEYLGAEDARLALESNQARPTALAAADFDEDGMPDLLSGYASPSGGGIITLRRGNVDAVYPKTAEAFARKKRGEFVDLPFLSPAMVFELAVAPDFLGAGDFDADGHWDIVAASRGGTALHFLKGDGRGHLAQAERIALPGAVTAFAVGEINRADGLADLVVGVESAEGARALVFESPLGALRGEPEVFTLPAPVTAFGLGLLDEHYAYDLAIAAGREVQIVAGRDRKLSLSDEQRADVAPAQIARHEFAAEVRALAAGDFTGEGMQDVAALTADNVLQVMRRLKSVPPAVAGGSQLSQHPPATAGGTDPSTQSQEVWQVTSAMSVEGVADGSPQLVAASVSPRWENDLLLLDGAGGPLRVLVADDETSYGKRREEGRENVAVSPRFRLGAMLDGAAVAASPLRLNMDGLKDLVVLRAGRSEPSVFQTAPTATFEINTTNDTPDANPGNNFCADVNGACSVRASIEEGNALGAILVLFFRSDLIGEIGLASPLPDINASTTIDGSIANGQKVRIRDNQPTPVPPNTPRPMFRLNAPNCVVENFIFNSAIDTAIEIAGPRAVMGGSYFGFTAGANVCTNADRNELGIRVTDAGDDAVVGGTTAAARNVFGCNRLDVSTDFLALNMTLWGNYFGLNENGDIGLPTVDTSVSINSANNRLGGPIVGAGNVFGRGSFAARYFQSPQGTSGNLFQGNQVGLNAAGTAPLGYSQWAIDLNGAPDNTIGGTVPTALNIISGNRSTNSSGASIGGGIGLGIATTGALVQGNIIGLGPNGVDPQPNANGVLISPGATNNTIGGAVDEASNVISANAGIGTGVGIGVNVQGNGNFVLGNYIGTDATGLLDRGNGANGVVIQSSNNNTIGGNVLSGNDGFGPLGGTGVTIVGGDGNTIEANLIGTNASGTQDLGNAREGVIVRSDGNNNSILRNVISGNDGFLAVEATNGANNKVQGNLIGTDATGANPIPNANNGVAANIIGGLLPGDGNTIANNGGAGVFKFDDMVILGNYIFANVGHGITHFPNDTPDTDGLQNFPDLTSAVTTCNPDNAPIPRGNSANPSPLTHVCQTVIQGTLSTTANTDLLLQFFANAESDPSGFGEGQSFIGEANVTTDANGSAPVNFTPSVAIPAGQFVTATATRRNAMGNPTTTSSFSQARQVTGAIPTADLSINKTDSPDPVAPGELITYTITVRNNGPNTAGNVTVRDTLPAETTFVSCTSDSGGLCPGIGNGRQIRFNSLASGAQATITLRARVKDSVTNGTIINNRANVSSITPDPMLLNNSAATMTTVDTPSMTSADLSITKTDSPDPVAAGSEIIYTITVANAGPNGAGTVIVRDMLPAGTTYVDGSCTSTGGGICGATAGGTANDRFVAFSSLGDGASATITLRARVDASIAPGTLINNTATINSDITPDPNTGNNSATATTTTATPPPTPTPTPSPTPTPTPSPTPTPTPQPTPVPRADLSITKTASPNPVLPGDIITYRINVTNNGPDTATNLSIFDSVPAGTTFLSCINLSGPCGRTGGSVRATRAALPNGSSWEILVTVRVKLSLGFAQTIANMAVVLSPTTDPNLANNFATATTNTPPPPTPTPTPTPVPTPSPTPTPTPTPSPTPDLSITKSATPEPVLPGQNINYTVTVMNNGPDAATDLVINDSLPVKTNFVSCTNLFGPCDRTGDLLTASRPALPSGGTWTITVVVSVDNSVGLGATIINEADVSSATPDPVPANDFAITTTHTPPPSVVISEFRTRGPGGTSDEFIELFNRGAVPINIGGWRLAASDAAGAATTLLTINSGTTIPAGGYFLATNSSDYSGTVPGDQTYTADIADDGGIALLMSDNTISDQVGLSLGSVFIEGMPLAPLSGNLNQSYERKPGGTNRNTQDTNDNQNDFLLRSPSDPQNLNSAIVPLVLFNAAIYTVAENAGSALVTVTRTGDLSSAITVDYATSDSTASDRSDYTTALGQLRFAAGETSKTFTVLLTDDVSVEPDETIILTLSNPTGGVGLGTPSVATLTITNNDTTPPTSNPIDNAQFFAHRHYQDFLNREPDAAGLAFWTDQITSCGADAQCREIRRINVSAAFFLSIEFQQTGFLVYRAHQAAFATGPALGFRDFLRDTQEIGRGVVVGQAGWEQQLEANTQAFFSDFVTRPQFLVRYPLTLTAAQYVDALNANTGGSLTQAERDALVAGLVGGTQTRATVLRAVAEDADFRTREFNRAFVFMQYLGYLRRRPNDPPDMNFDGYNFWLAKLNQFNGNFIDAEMVKAFILSGEFRGRFGP